MNGGRKSCVFVLPALAILTIAGCGGGGGGGSATLYSIGGTVSGLAGTGLVLQNNGGNNSPVTADGAFALNAPIAKDSTYNVTVYSQPINPAQTCAVTNGSGTATSNVTNIGVVCSTIAYTIGGTVTGLSGSGLVLQDNGGNNLPIGGNGFFVFSSPVNLGAAYSVTVLDQPTNPAQTCTVSNGSGTASAAVTNVQVVCSVTIGGTVSGLAGTGLVLQLNGANDQPIGSNGAFTFTAPIAYGSSYTVTVLDQPSGPAQACLVIDGSGTANASVTNIQVNCSAAWILRGFSSAASYGVMGVAAASNLPGARTGAVTWKDAAGDFWLYGGAGSGAGGNGGELGDLWKYSAGEWTWMGGSNLVNQPGTYGKLGVADAANTPGARSGAAAWTDASGNFWLFGGGGVDAQGDNGEFNDMWMYSKGQWTWMSGPNTPNVAGSFGQQGVAAASNLPEPRISAATWVDASGDLWLFGGEKGTGGGSDEVLGWFGDLWKYSAGQWTWVGGQTGVNQGGSYGVLGKADPANTPGSRTGAAVWTAKSGEVFLFGGFGYDKNDIFGDLSDLWSYSGGQWTWLGGPDTDEVPGSYGILGVAAASNLPGARDTSNAWMDASGDLWLFGGAGLGSVETFSLSLGDTWRYSKGEWTWMDGSNAVSQPPIYGTLGSAGYPGARTGAATWTDKNGNLWLFGGVDYGHTSAGSNQTFYNDLWEYRQ